MKIKIVKLYYPNRWRDILSTSSKKECSAEDRFNWFICSQREYDSDKNLYFVSISQKAQFYSEKTGESFFAPEVDSKKVRLVILSDPHNKKILCSMFDCKLKCDSDRSILSTECELVTDKKHVKKLAKKIIEDLGYDGVVIRHDCKDEYKKNPKYPLCDEVSFYFKNDALKNYEESGKIEDTCDMIKYAIKHNTSIKNKIGNFPSISEIKNATEKYGCNSVSLVLKKYIDKYSKT